MHVSTAVLIGVGRGGGGGASGSPPPFLFAKIDIIIINQSINKAINQSFTVMDLRGGASSPPLKLSN